MANRKQRLKRPPEPGGADRDKTDSGPARLVPSWVGATRNAALILLGALVVYVAYYPSDSILVERGDALWFVAGTLVLAILTMASEPFVRAGALGKNTEPSARARSLVGDHLMIDVLAWNLAVWMMIAAFVSCPPNNLRHATNEAWLWVSGAAVLTAARRLLASRSAGPAMIALLSAVSIGMSVLALHQNWISLPETRAAYLNDPAAVMQAAGIEAPEWSTRQMIFANRLLDGGPTATFALANSLAAVLPLGLLVAIAVLVNAWRNDRPWPLRIGVMALVGLVSFALAATRSRSAVAACLIGVAWLFIGQPGGKVRLRQRLFTVVAVSAAALLITIGFLLLGDEEWMASAPSSLLFRLRYWRSTIAMLSDAPWVGVGPGGFQAVYLRYRLPVASETIADPHHFLFETLAAGGLVAGGLFAVFSWACVRASMANADDKKIVDHWPPDSSVGIFYGATGSLLLVWTFALASGQLPDYRAAVFAIPIAIAAAWMLHRELVRLGEQRARALGVAALVSVLTHLSFAGGWTVPGVVMQVWLVTAMLCHAGIADVAATTTGESNANRSSRRFAMAGALTGMLLLIALRFVSIGPVQASKLAQARAEDALRRGLGPRGESESARAVDADPWAVEPALWRSELLMRRLVAAPQDVSAPRSDWDSAVELVLDRGGESPLVLRAIGEQRLHVYQRFGRREDLARADDILALALERNPTDVSLTAQVAIVAAERGDDERARRLAKRAENLSLLGGNVVQALGLQHIYEVRHLGGEASGSAQLRRVEEEFRRRLGTLGSD